MHDPMESWQRGQPLELIIQALNCFQREAGFQHAAEPHPNKKQIANLLKKEHLWYAKSQDGTMLACAEFIELPHGSKHKLFPGNNISVAMGAVMVKRVGAHESQTENMRDFYGLVKACVKWLCPDGDQPTELWFEIFEEDLAMKAVVSHMGLKYYGSKIVGQGQVKGLYAIADLKPEQVAVQDRIGVKPLARDFLDPEEVEKLLLGIDKSDNALIATILKRIGNKLGLADLTPEEAKPWVNLVPPGFDGPRMVAPENEPGKIQLRVTLQAPPEERAHVSCWSLRGAIWRMPLEPSVLYYLDQRKPHAYYNTAAGENAVAEFCFEIPIEDSKRIEWLSEPEQAAVEVG